MQFREAGTTIRVLRLEHATAHRRGKLAVVGEIPLATLVPSAELLDACTAAERQEIGEWIGQFKHARQVRDEATAYALADAVRSTIEYLRTVQSEQERRFLLAMMDAARRDLTRALRLDVAAADDIDE